MNDESDDGGSSSDNEASRSVSKVDRVNYGVSDYKNDVEDSVKDIDHIKFQGMKPSIKSSFDDTKKIKIQISWSNITIKAPPKAGFCKKLASDAESFTILGKSKFHIHL
jgi:leucyl aminopeptidase